ncbi:hypothetical protein INT43_003829 [Umbelopsis isabellina]|uniref:BZIP domain-containing protein n=1 Tax=Mortierella isabellina TaxID=91625 RepID=A0A8H7PTH0_MORIS|nr:hypothetical protein INT43_003829 [Umbelopsis isabellina]
MSNWNFQHFDTQSEIGIVDENGVTHRVRKKPGRKANPAASAQRKAQNRAAQRAFRERKQREKKENDATMRRTNNEIAQLRRTVKELSYENKQLKGILLSYILTCFEMNTPHPRVNGVHMYGGQHKSQDEDTPTLLNVFMDESKRVVNMETAALNLIDADSPYPHCTAPSRNLNNERKLRRMFDEALILDELPNQQLLSDNQTATDAIPGCNHDLFSSAASTSSPDTNITYSSPNGDGMASQSVQSESEVSQPMQLEEELKFPPPYISTNDNTPVPGIQRFCQNLHMPTGASENLYLLASNRQVVQDVWNNVVGSDDKFINAPPPPSWGSEDPATFANWDTSEYSYPPMHPLQAVQLLRLQMKVGNILGNDKDILNPTDLQAAVVHDRRIDYIPGPGMRDRMILFRDHYDADDCFNMLATKSIFLGGDVTNPSNWALPEKFYEKYWFLCANQVGVCTVETTLKCLLNYEF